MSTKLYVGNLPDNCSEDTIRDLFGSYGDMTELVMIKNFAFVHFKNVEDANCAVRDLNGTKMLGKQLTVAISKSKGGKDKGGDRRNQSRDNQSRDNQSRDNQSRDNQKLDNQWRDNSHRYGNHNNPRFTKENDQWNGDQNNIGFMGGILGNIPTAHDTISPQTLGDLGILSAVSTLAAVAEKQRNIQQQRNVESFPENHYNPEPDRIDLGSKQGKGNTDEGLTGNSSGYVIYERYYVDRNHPLLNGLPLPKLPHIEDDYISRTKNFTDNLASLDTKLSDPYSHVDLDSYHSHTNRMNMDHDRDSNKFRI